MKKQSKPKGPRNLDKHLFEAGLQCHKRLWLDCHDPAPETQTVMRREMARAGTELRELARQAFPKGVKVAAEGASAAAEETQARLAEGCPVLFDAAFVHDGVEVRCDVLVAHKDKLVDLFEIKSGTKVNHRYVNDLALQAAVLESCGMTLRAAFLLHVNAKYVHKAGEDYPPMQLLRSADVTAKVQQQVPHIRRRLQQLRQALENDAVLGLPMGTYCRTPLPCPHLARCRAEAPSHPLLDMPELTRPMEVELHKEGIEQITAIDPARADLTFRQRRTIACLASGQRIVEPFVANELQQCTKPLHFVDLLATTEPLPRFDRQRPWQIVPYGWAAQTLHADGRVESREFVHVERTDPRPDFARTLAKHLEVGGTVFCWGDEVLRELRVLLDAVPDDKVAVRALLGRPHLDMRQLFEAGVFDPHVTTWGDLRETAQVLLGDDSGAEFEMLDAEACQLAMQKAMAPRVRSTTREKIATEILAAMRWRAERLARVYRLFVAVDEKPAPKKVTPARPRAAKPLPKLPE